MGLSLVVVVVEALDAFVLTLRLPQVAVVVVGEAVGLSSSFLRLCSTPPQM
jgi:hypothetical protein